MDADETGSTKIVASHQLVHGEFQKIEQNKGVDFQDYEFVVSYLVELLLNYLIYYPLVGVLLFSGLLNCCGRFPVLGGRPYEIKQLKDKSELDSDLEEGVEVEWNDEGEKSDDGWSSTSSVDTPDLEDVEVDSSEQLHQPDTKP